MIIRTGGRVYRVYREIGRGRLTRVYLARPHGATRPVAVKMLDERAAGDPGIAEQFQRDAHLASQLRDERVVGVLGVGERAGTPFVVMEYVEGTTLAALVRDHGPLPLPDAVAIVDQVLRAVEAVASAGIAHRDLGSHNLVLTRSGTVKLLDFGIPASGALAGAPSDARSDLPVLRALLRELLTGETASDGPSPARETRPDVLAEVDAMLERVVTTSPGEMRTALGQLLSGRGQADRASSDAPPSAAEGTPLWRRGRVRGLAAGLALLALVGAAVLFEAVTGPTPAVGAVDPPAATGPTRTPTLEPTATPLLGPVEALRRLSGAAPPTSAPSPTERPQPAPPPAGYPPPGTRTPTPRATSTPLPGETADELWSATLTRVDAAWSKSEWLQVIAELDAFRGRVPDYPGVDEKLYGALVSYGVALQQQGRSALAARYFSRAQTLQPERGEAATALITLSASPTLEPASTPAAPVAAASAPSRASAARAAPPPTPVVEQVDEPAPPSPAADPPTPLPPSPTPVPPTPTPTPRPTRTPTPSNLPPTLTPTPTRAPATPTPTPTATPTATPVPPTATRVPPTATPRRTPTPATTPSPAPPTATPRTTAAQPTAPPTAQPPTATPTLTPTPASVLGATAPSPTRAP